METARMDGVRLVIVLPAVIEATIKALRVFGKRHLEGLVLWLGNVEPGKARVIRAVIPDQHSVHDEDGLGYFVSGKTLFQLNKTLAETGLRLIAQVHSHPDKAYHSAADDRYAIVTANGGFSLVVPNFGRAPADPVCWAVYRLTEGHWLKLASDEVENLFEIEEQ